MRALPVLLMLAISACGPTNPGIAQPGGPSSQPAATRPDRTLVAAVRVEPPTLAERPIQTATGFAGLALVRRISNAELTLLDDRLVRHPYLAEALPQLDTASWQVLPGGQMETNWKLKPGLTWHDSAPFSAEDFVFAWRVYASPEFGAAGSRLIRTIQEVSAPDDRTLVIRYRQPYPYADDLTGSDGFPPLPRQILEQPFQQLSPDAFANHPFWTREYIGLGPYRLDHWEPGSFVQGVAFDQHVLGRPKIGRIKVMFIADGNAALANVLAREVDFVGDTAIVLDQAFTLKREWESRGAGTVLYRTSQWRHTAFQLRSELVNPRALLDVRVRQALAYGVDRQAITDGIYQGEMALADSIISPLSQWGPAVADSVRKYPYDLRLSELSMNDAGFVKAADGFYVPSPSGRPAERDANPQGRFSPELKTTVDREDEGSVLANGLKRSGFDVNFALLPAALSIDPEARVTFPGMFTSITSQGEGTLPGFTTAQIPKAENNWRSGNNRGGWSNPDYDRLVEAFTSTLNPKERATELAQMMKIFTEELPAISLLFLAQPYAYVEALHGVLPVAPEGDITWNLHEWEYRSN